MNILERFRRWLSRAITPDAPRRPTDDAMTIPMTSQQLAQALAGEGRRHVGLGSGQGEGAKRVALFTLVGNSDGHNVLPDFSLIGVADGPANEDRHPIISDLAIKTFSEYMIRNAVLDLLSLDSSGDTSPFQDAVISGFKAAQDAVARAHPDATFAMTAGLMFSEILILGHVGNTRAYIIDRAHIEQITYDQPVAGGSNGRAMGSEDSAHESSGVASLGDNLEVNVYSRPVPRGGYLLLCSSGLSASLADGAVVEIFNELEDPQAVSDRLIMMAEENGNASDSSVVILYFPPDFGSWR